MSAAGFVAVDGKGDAALVGGDDLLAGVAALLERSLLSIFRGRIIVGVAIGRTFADRESACGTGRDQSRSQHPEHSDSRETGAQNVTHGLPPKTTPASKTKVVKPK